MIAVMFAVSASVLGLSGRTGYEGQPGNQGNGQLGYEGQPGNQGNGQLGYEGRPGHQGRR